METLRMILAVVSALTFSGALLGTFRDLITMTKHDAALYPGEFVIERRWKSDGQWELIYRDDDFSVMRKRFDYWKNEQPLPPGQAIRFFSPDCKLIEEYPAV